MTTEKSPAGKGAKVVIIVALIAAAGVVLYLKERPEGSPSEPLTASAQVESVGKDNLSASPGTVNTSAPLPRLVDLGSNKCQSCLAMVPVLEALTSEYEGQLEVVFIDVWKNLAEADRYEVKLIPTQVFLDGDGKELFRHEGFFSKEDILTKWKKLGFKFDG